MAVRVLEGTWEEIEKRKDELIGHRLRVSIQDDTPAATDTIRRHPAPSQKPKELRAWGMLAGILSSEEYFREKRADTEREDRDLG